MTAKKGFLILGIIVVVLIFAALVYVAFFTSLTITTTDPVKNEMNVSTNKVITVTFNKPIKSGNYWIELQNSAGTVIPITKDISNNILTITPKTALSKGTKYTLLIHTDSVSDLSGKGIAAYTTSFTTTS